MPDGFCVVCAVSPSRCCDCSEKGLLFFPGHCVRTKKKTPHRHCGERVLLVGSRAQIAYTPMLCFFFVDYSLDLRLSLLMWYSFSRFVG